MDKKTFVIYSEFGETLDLALHLRHIEGHEVLFYVPDPHCRTLGMGMIKKIDEWFACLGKDYIWIVDGTSTGKFQDWLRSQGEKVFGSSEAAAQLEDDRQRGQTLFKHAGFNQPHSQNFKSIDEAIAFVEKNKHCRWILKQNGNAPKFLNHVGRFPDGTDMLFHLKELKKQWNEMAFGRVDFDLMEVVEGMEVAASAFFNGQDWMRNSRGKIVGYLNFEEKKEADDGMGETCGEMGTTFVSVTEDNPIFKDIMLRDVIKNTLVQTGFRGVFDINGCLTKERGYVAFEFTARPGIPATSYEFMEGLRSNTGEMLSAVAEGRSEPIDLHPGIGMVMCVVAKPFPLEFHVEDMGNSLGERLWSLQDGKPIKTFSREQEKHIHLYNFSLTEDPEMGERVYKVATDSGYMLTVTGRGESVPEVRAQLINYIKSNLYLSGMKYRTDIGKRAEDFIKALQL